MGFFPYLSAHGDSLLNHLAQHIYISFSAILLSLLLGVPAGIWVRHQSIARGGVLALANVFQTIPSLALLAFLVPFLGIGYNPTIVTLTVYALLPIIRNTYTGLAEVPAEYIESANALGFTYWQRLFQVELPLAMPTLLSGIRIATAVIIGITTIAAFIGAGGLGDFITRGLAMADNNLILLGAIPTAILALALDFVLSHIESSLVYFKQAKKRLRQSKRVLSSIIMMLIAVVLIKPFYRFWLSPSHQGVVVIAAKNTTEQYILSDMMADLISEHTQLRVKKRYNLGSTNMIQQAMLKGEVDLYPEYTGTAYMVILKQAKLLNQQQTYHYVKEVYQKRFHLLWLAPLGFSNSQTLAVTDAFANQYKLATLSDLALLAVKLTIAAPSEFIMRADAYPALKHAYGFHFKKIIQMEPSLMYQAIANGDAQVIEAFTSDAMIALYHLRLLKDDRKIYPPYDAAPVIREETLEKHPEIVKAIAPLIGAIDQKTMQHLNYLVDVKKQTPEQVARDFLWKSTPGVAK